MIPGAKSVFPWVLPGYLGGFMRRRRGLCRRWDGATVDICGYDWKKVFDNPNGQSIIYGRGGRDGARPYVSEGHIVNEGYYILLSLRGKKCVVVGGGSIATRKVDALCRCGADVTIVSPKFCETLRNRSDVTLVHEPYDKQYIQKATLVFACADEQAVNQAGGHRLPGSQCAL